MPPPYCYDYPRPAVTVDLAIFAISADGLRVLLIRRKKDPFAGEWALPGGFLEIDEPIETGARRELKEETGLEAPSAIKFLGVYADPTRDPRGRTISMAHAAVIRGEPPIVSGRDDASEAAWRMARSGRGTLAFDHEAMLDQAIQWLAAEVRSTSLGLELLPEFFDESDVRSLYRALDDSATGASQWLRKMLKMGWIEPREGHGRTYHAARPSPRSQV
jgi:8-oxo-dGTP diphosphatase